MNNDHTKSYNPNEIKICSDVDIIFSINKLATKNQIKSNNKEQSRILPKNDKYIFNDFLSCNIDTIKPITPIKGDIKSPKSCKDNIAVLSNNNNNNINNNIKQDKDIKYSNILIDELTTNISNKCRKCNTWFNNKKELYNHIKLHHWNQYKCNQCQKQFVNELLLKTHINRYHNNNTIQWHCKQCKKAFKNKKYLQKHARTHFGNQYKKSCNICGKIVADNTRLKIHMRIHSGIKPYKCIKCGYLFNDPNAYRRHNERCKSKNINNSGTNTDIINEYSCDICSDKFTNKQIFYQHLTSYHSSKIVFI